jgi:hypothetical protein
MSHDAPTIDRALAQGISGKRQAALGKVFQHPLSHNLTWRELTHLFKMIGSVEPRPNGDLMLRIGGEQLSLKPARSKDLDATEIMDVRHLLVRAGWSDKGTELATPGPAATLDVLVVIDHAGARLYPILPESQTMAVEETRHLLHEHIDRKRHDADRDEDYPADTRFFEAVAEALPARGRIVLVSEGKGQSNEAGHFVAYLNRHHHLLSARIADTLVADISHTTVPQIVTMARTAIGTMPSP